MNNFFTINLEYGWGWQQYDSHLQIWKDYDCLLEKVEEANVINSRFEKASERFIINGSFHDGPFAGDKCCVVSLGIYPSESSTHDSMPCVLFVWNGDSENIKINFDECAVTKPFEGMIKGYCSLRNFNREKHCNR